MSALLQIQALSHVYRGSNGEVRAVNDVSLTVDAGEFVVVQGPSGCGKTTLLLATGTLLQPSGGQILINRQNPYALSAEARAEFRAANLGFVFQQFHLIPYLSVWDNILAPVLARPQRDARERAQALIAHFGLQERTRHVPAELSTGERQRTALARALLSQPKLLLADEPTGNLDRENATLVLGYLAEFARTGGAVLLVTHDIAAAQFAGRMLCLKDGKLVES